MSICPVIITFQPDIALLEESLARLRPQVATVLLVDNGSRLALVEELRRLAAAFECDLLENTQNLGIAEALNQGVEFARTLGAEFVLFFDQDSTTNPGFVAHEVECYREASKRQKIGLVAPTIIRRSNGETSLPIRSRKGDFVLAQTSGALMPLSVFQDAGLFRADMFIDYVDYEHCLRMATRGWRIVHAPQAELDHMPGNAVPVHFLGRTILTVSASPLRHYYEVRNCLWVVAHYFFSAPATTAWLLYHMVKVRVRALLFEPHRLSKLSASFQGFADALRGRMGARPAIRIGR